MTMIRLLAAVAIAILFQGKSHGFQISRHVLGKQLNYGKRLIEFRLEASKNKKSTVANGKQEKPFWFANVKDDKTNKINNSQNQEKGEEEDSKPGVAKAAAATGTTVAAARTATTMATTGGVAATTVAGTATTSTTGTAAGIAATSSSATVGSTTSAAGTVAAARTATTVATGVAAATSATTTTTSSTAAGTVAAARSAVAAATGVAATSSTAATTTSSTAASGTVAVARSAAALATSKASTVAATRTATTAASSIAATTAVTGSVGASSGAVAGPAATNVGQGVLAGTVAATKKISMLASSRIAAIGGGSLAVATDAALDSGATGSLGAAVDTLTSSGAASSSSGLGDALMAAGGEIIGDASTLIGDAVIDGMTSAGSAVADAAIGVATDAAIGSGTLWGVWDGLHRVLPQWVFSGGAVVLGGEVFFAIFAFFLLSNANTEDSEESIQEVTRKEDESTSRSKKVESPPLKSVVSSEFFDLTSGDKDVKDDRDINAVLTEVESALKAAEVAVGADQNYAVSKPLKEALVNTSAALQDVAVPKLNDNSNNITLEQDFDIDRILADADEVINAARESLGYNNTSTIDGSSATRQRKT
mmetsp:Transcript_15844/g.24003  ORF Transcript_15844/g.24003 Transcript_15844/m.24003 type:complete len:595 (+) Transcript_15844:172-1956(+)